MRVCSKRGKLYAVEGRFGREGEVRWGEGKKGVDRWEKKNGVDGPSVCVSGRDGNPRGDQSNEYGGINTDAM